MSDSVGFSNNFPYALSFAFPSSLKQFNQIRSRNKCVNLFYLNLSICFVWIIIFQTPVISMHKFTVSSLSTFRILLLIKLLSFPSWLKWWLGHSSHNFHFHQHVILMIKWKDKGQRSLNVVIQPVYYQFSWKYATINNSLFSDTFYFFYNILRVQIF